MRKWNHVDGWKNMTLWTEFCGQQQADSKSNRITPDRDIVRGGNPCAVFIDYVTKSAVHNRLWDVLLFCFYSSYMLYVLQLWALFCPRGHITTGNFEMPHHLILILFECLLYIDFIVLTLFQTLMCNWKIWRST